MLADVSKTRLDQAVEHGDAKGFAQQFTVDATSWWPMNPLPSECRSMAAYSWAVQARDTRWCPRLNQGETGVLYCFVFLYFLFSGPGAWSADAVRRSSTVPALSSRWCRART